MREDVHMDWFDIGFVDPTLAVVSIVRGIVQNMEYVVGSELAALMFEPLMSRFSSEEKGWRLAVDEPGFYVASKLGKQLNALVGYASFGLFEADRDGEIGAAIAAIEKLLVNCPTERWLDEEENELLIAIATMSRARWNLDHEQGLSPEGLALLGGVKLSRIRNMMAGTHPELPKDPSGLISCQSARAWLENRDCFLPTIFKSTATKPQVTVEAAATPIFLPVARDGSMFTPDLLRGGHYQVGGKAEERHVADFDEALAALQAMPVARWRRPNAEGNWGLVSAIEWRRVEHGSLTQRL